MSAKRDTEPKVVDLTWNTTIDNHRLERVARILKKIVDHARATKEGRKP